MIANELIFQVQQCEHSHIEDMHILVVDDQVGQLRPYLEQISQLCNVSFARNANEGFVKMAQNTPDLVIVDLLMPDMDGFKFIDVMRKRSSFHCPIVMLSHSDDHLTYTRAYEHGVVEFMSKNITPEIFYFRIRAQLIHIQRERYIAQLSFVDPMTHLANRRRFDTQYNAAWLRCQRQEKPLSVLVIDVDDFKHYNTFYGYASGDECLQNVAAILTQFGGRSDDLLARLDGVQFVLMLPECSLTGAKAIANDIVGAINDAQIPHQGSRSHIYLSVSVGVACIVPSPSDEPLDLIGHADAYLHVAKKSGKNAIHAGE